ncbi:GPW/gp25 family protein [Nocardioides sp. BP30]|uniref:GPW/gp25 family protein n=1 Tax=Nocardioides sp. BP30 TaxID=3036374 RepID=UPI00246848E8|nr:GPW/gp25 family protein [Nocardioides sp. BP30]WGL52094.1 GPW/gp25 family protein [Nocardioides sp. BP30]
MTSGPHEGRLPARVTGQRDPRVPAGTDPSFLGSGFAWPLGVDHTGSIRLSDPVADLDRSIELVLMTAPGERLMRPQFGCRIWDLLFEPVTPNLLGQIAVSVRQAIAQWEPRVEVDEVVPVPDQDEPALVRIGIAYRIRATNDRRNLVYPFYLIPHDSEE